ncbi:MAG: thermonuclease family protein [Pseudomonadota bacterium]
MIARWSLIAGLLASTLATAETLEGQVTHVRDGDTIEVTGVPVRLRGVNCEEWDKPRGRQATERMVQLTRGKGAVCTLNGERNGDCVIGWCSVDGIDLGDTLIRERICARCNRYDPERRYVDAQAAAGSWRGRVPGYCK